MLSKTDLSLENYHGEAPHLLVCSAYERFRVGKDFDKDEDLVEYVKCVLQERVQNT